MRWFGLKSTGVKKFFLENLAYTSIEQKYGAFYLKSKVSAHGLILLVQLS